MSLVATVVLCAKLEEALTIIVPQSLHAQRKKVQVGGGCRDTSKVAPSVLGGSAPHVVTAGPRAPRCSVSACQHICCLCVVLGLENQVLQVSKPYGPFFTPQQCRGFGKWAYENPPLLRWICNQVS